MLPIAIKPDEVRFGDRLTIRFERTLRVPDDGSTYPLPPGLGHFAMHKVEDYADRVPPPWRESGGVFITMHQAEALWLSFHGARWKPNALTVAVGRVNVVSGGPWPARLEASPQNYLVSPPQLWLDGINAGSGFVRQFVAMPLGRGVTVEGQITGVEAHGGLQIRVFDPKPGRFPDAPPDGVDDASGLRLRLHAAAAPMGFVPGGKIEQKVLEDEHGLDTWDEHQYGTLLVHVLNTSQYRAVTGKEAPSSPIDARTYTEYGFPWFRLYEEDHDVPPAEALAGLTSIADIDKSTGKEKSVDVPPDQIVGLERTSGPGRRPQGE